MSRRLNAPGHRPFFISAATTMCLVVSAALAFSACSMLAEENSGGDAYRNEAKEMAINEWIVDDISYLEGDRTDWKFILLAQPTAFVVELSADDADAEIKLGVYDRYGMQLGLTERNENNKVARLKIKRTERNGKHFIMVKATDGDPTSYQVRVRVGDSSGGGGNLPDF